jgi:hypothetical protein
MVVESIRLLGRMGCRVWVDKTLKALASAGKLAGSPIHRARTDLPL